ncbi:MAG: 4Fe-4S dicluster domain-containing protein [Planctomycetota bacterium]
MGRVIVSELYCKGCGLCVEVCTKEVLVMDRKANAQGVRPAVVRAEVPCALCGRCALMCPDAAITLEEDGQETPPSSEEAEDVASP